MIRVFTKVRKIEPHIRDFGGSAAGISTPPFMEESTIPPSATVTVSEKEKTMKASRVNVVKHRSSLSKHEFQRSVVEGSEMVEIPEVVIGDTPLWRIS